MGFKRYKGDLWDALYLLLCFVATIGLMVFVEWTQYTQFQCYMDYYSK